LDPCKVVTAEQCHPWLYCYLTGSFAVGLHPPWPSSQQWQNEGKEKSERERI